MAGAHSGPRLPLPPIPPPHHAAQLLQRPHFASPSVPATHHVFLLASVTLGSLVPVATQALRRTLRPENSGRNAFRRAWSKLKQIKWNSGERKELVAAAVTKRDEKRVQRWRQKAAWAAQAAKSRA